MNGADGMKRNPVPTHLFCTSKTRCGTRCWPGITLNIFNNHCERVRMANLAQIVNVLQSVILTNKQKIILTPTYHVMEMYNVHQDARMIPVTFGEHFLFGRQRQPACHFRICIPGFTGNNPYFPGKYRSGKTLTW